MLFMSEVFIFTHLRHECTGRDCKVCAEIQIAENVVRQIGTAIVVDVVLLFYIHKINSQKRYVIMNEIFRSLVSDKVRLNN